MEAFCRQILTATATSIRLILECSSGAIVAGTFPLIRDAWIEISTSPHCLTTVTRNSLLEAALGLHELMDDLGVCHFAMNEHIPRRRATLLASIASSVGHRLGQPSRGVKPIQAHKPDIIGLQPRFSATRRPIAHLRIPPPTTTTGCVSQVSWSAPRSPHPCCGARVGRGYAAPACCRGRARNTGSRC
jgi:hypothetical protein